MTDDKDVVDLHPSEWHETGKKEPFWGYGAYEFFAYTIGAIIATIIIQSTFAPFLYWLIR